MVIWTYRLNGTYFAEHMLVASIEYVTIQSVVGAYILLIKIIFNFAQFWMKYSVDRENGGYFTCLDANVTVFDFP